MSELALGICWRTARFAVRRNRTYDRAIRLAQKFNGQAIEFSRLYEPAIAPTS